VTTLTRRRTLGRSAAIVLPQLVLTPIDTDNFQRADASSLGAAWTATSFGSMGVSGNEAVGTTAAIKSNVRVGTYSNDQYARITVGSINSTTGSFIDTTVRNDPTGANGYAMLYFTPGGAPQLNLYKRVAGGSYTQLLSYSFTSGQPLPAGTVLTLVAEGSRLTAYVNTTPIWTFTDTTFASGAPGITSFNPVTGDAWEGGNAHTGALGAATATDDFARADGGMSSGQTGWAAMTGYPAVDIPIVSGQLNVSSGTHAADKRTDAFSGDQWSSVKMGTIAPNSSGFVGMVLRVNAGSNSGYLGCLFEPTDGHNSTPSYRIYRLDNGASTLLGNVEQGSADPAGTKYTFVAKGTRLSFRVNDCEVLAVTDATYAVGAPGIQMFPSSTADNWAGGNV
jgi:hypothetical protein